MESGLIRGMIRGKDQRSAYITGRVGRAIRVRALEQISKAEIHIDTQEGEGEQLQDERRGDSERSVRQVVEVRQLHGTSCKSVDQADRSLANLRECVIAESSLLILAKRKTRFMRSDERGSE